MRMPYISRIPGIHHDKPVESKIFQKDNTLTGMVKSTEESSRSLTYVDLYRNYNRRAYQKITTTIPETKILFDNSTKPEPLAPGLQKSHDIAPIVAARGSNALQPPKVIEHKATHIEKGKNNDKINHIKTIKK